MNNNYQRLNEIEEEVILLLSKDLSVDMREKIKSFGGFIKDVLDNIKESEARTEDIDDLLLFLFGYDLNEIVKNGKKQIDEFNAMIKDSEE